MSTILDALKKVEQERQTDSSASRQRQLDALRPPAERPQNARTRSYIKWGATALLILFLGATTAYLFLGDDQPPATQASRSAEDRSKAAAPQKKTKRTTLSRNQNKQPKQPVQRPTPGDVQQQGATLPNQAPVSPQAAPDLASRAPNPNQTAPAGSNNIRPANPAERPSNRPPDSQISRPSAPAPRPGVNPAAPERPKAVAPTPNAAPQPKRPQPRPTPRSTPREIDRLTDGTLNVQAIAWSPVPEESMAVMNGKIVREGGSVDDYDLVSIRQDDVVVRKGGREWRVLIGRN